MINVTSSGRRDSATEHQSRIRCQDRLGMQGVESVVRYVIYTTPPLIIPTSPLWSKGGKANRKTKYLLEFHLVGKSKAEKVGRIKGG